MGRLHTALALIGLLALASTAAVAGAAQADDGRGGPRPSDMHFKQQADAGSLESRGGKLVLRLRGVPPTAAWFEPKLGGENRRVSNQRLVHKILRQRSLRPPLATLRTRRPDGSAARASFRIERGSWNATRGSVTYRVRPAQGPGSLRQLPRRFGSATLVGVVNPTPRRPPLGCHGSDCAVKNIAELIEWTYTFFSQRNTCTGAIANFSGSDLKWVADDEKKEDSWQVNPPRLNRHNASAPYPVVDTFQGWTTVSAWLRGCWNNVRYSNQYGTVEVGVSDPYSGGNDWLCRTTGELRCLGPDFKVHGRPGWPGHYSELGGRHMAVAVCVYRGNSIYPCNDDPWE